MPKLVAFASAVYVDKHTKLAMSYLPLRLDREGKVVLAKLGTCLPPPKLDASNCVALLCPLSVP